MTKKLGMVLVMVMAVAAAYYGATTLSHRRTVTGDATLRLRLESFSLGLDPASILDTQSRRVIDMLHARLVAEDARGNFTGELAERWEWTDSLTLKVLLKSGMVFSDGRPVRANDVAWSICRHVQPTAVFVWLFANIEHRKIDDKTADCTGIHVDNASALSIHVAHSPARLLHALASSMGAIVPEGSKPGEYGSLVGAGPFRIERIESNAAVHLVASPGGPIKPGVARAVLRYVPDDAAASAQFAAGQLDVLEIGNPRLLQMTRSARSRDGVRSSTVDTHQVRLMIINVDRLLSSRGWTEPRVRQFLTALRDASVQAGLEGVHGELGRRVESAYFPARAVAEKPAVTAPSDDSRGTEAVSFQIVSENDPYSEQIATSLPRTIGQVQLEFLGLDKSLLLDRLLQKDYDIASITLEALVADPAYWASFFKPGSPFTLFGRAIAALDGVEADADNIAQIAETIDTQGNWIVLFQERREYLFQPGVANERILPTGLIDFSPMTKTRGGT